MKKNPLVSVLMTVYNREKYIAEAIESVLASTYQNWELIIVDDQSKDRSVAIASSFSKNEPRIQVYVNSENLGDYPNRNQAACFAKGKYLKYVDADDMIYPYGLEQLVFFMEQFPKAGYGLCSLKQDKYHIYPFQLGPKEAYKRHYFESPLFHKAPLSSIIRRDIFEEIGGFTGKRMLGDFEMWHLLSQNYPVVLMPYGLVWYREHDDQEMALHRDNPMERFKYLILAKKLLRDDLCPLSNKDANKAIRNLEKIQARSIISAVKHHSAKKALELYRNSGLGILEVFKKLF